MTSPGGLTAAATDAEDARTARALLDAMRIRLAELGLLDAADTFWKRLLEYRDLRAPDADVARMATELQQLAVDTFDDVLAPVVLDAMAQGAAAAGVGVLLPDLDRADVLDHLATALSQVVGVSQGGDALARQAPIADELVEEWRAVLTNAQTYGWEPTRIREELDYRFAFDGASSRQKLRDRLARLDRDVDLAVARAGFPDRQTAEALGWGNDASLARLADMRDDAARLLRETESVSARTFTTATGDTAVRPAGRLRYTIPGETGVRTALAGNLPDDAVIIGKVRHGWEARAERIARTETVRAFNAGAVSAGRAAYGEGAHKQWLAVIDPRTRDHHVSADGQCVPINQPFTVNGEKLPWPGQGGSAANVVNCLTGADRVLPLGSLLRVYRAPFHGELIRVELSNGHHFTATPNHPVLTRAGWVPAKHLQVSTQLLDAGPVRLAGVPQVEDRPPTLQQLFSACQQLGTSGRVSGSTVDLHGDLPAGHVDVVTLDRDLSLDGVPLAEQIRNPAFRWLADRQGGCSGGCVGAPRPVVSAPGQGLIPDLPTHLPASSSGCVGSCSSGPSVSGGGPGSLHPVGLADSPWVHTVLSQSSVDGGPADPQSLREAVDRLPADVAVHDVVSVQWQPGGHRGSYVYTLETSTGMYGSPWGTVHRNCRCSVLIFPGPCDEDPADDAFAEALQQDPVVQEQVELRGITPDRFDPGAD